MIARALAPFLVVLAAAFAAPALAAPPSPARAVLLAVPANLPPELLGRAVSARVAVRATVTPAGLVESARAAAAGDARLRAAAEAAVRWWVFAPGPQAETVDVTVEIRADADAHGLYPDVLALAREAEAQGELPNALAGWTGALARVGQSPLVTDPWALREHAIEIARRMPDPPPIPGIVGANVKRARVEQLRTVARGAHADLVPRFDGPLAAAPWWGEAWLWRAGSLAGCGRVAEALQSLRACRLAERDTATFAFAGRMIERLAAADTVGVCEAIKSRGVVTEPRSR